MRAVCCHSKHFSQPASPSNKTTTATATINYGSLKFAIIMASFITVASLNLVQLSEASNIYKENKSGAGSDRAPELPPAPSVVNRNRLATSGSANNNNYRLRASSQESQRPLKGDEYEKLTIHEQKTISEHVNQQAGVADNVRSTIDADDSKSLKQKSSSVSTAGQQHQDSSSNVPKRAIGGSSLVKPTSSVSAPANVLPSRETDKNGQVVYVNFARLVSDSGSGKNDTTRLVSNNERLIKRDGQIPCGETNRNGKPSMEGQPPTSGGEFATIPNRIVGGNKADPGEFPFQVRLNIRSIRGSSLCGGVIIDKRHILSAAHCVTTCSSYFVTSNVEPTSVQATIGDLRITVADGEQTIAIEKVTPHQKYSACSYSHNNFDLAILKTSKPMTWMFTEDGFGSVNRICLPHPFDEYQTGENVTVTGWGVMAEEEGRISNALNVVEIPVVSLEECKVAYGQRVGKDHLCAGLKEGGKDSCQGDSGGPLFRRRGGQSELAGIVSFGYGCAQAGSPGVYTKVSHYIDWIKQNL